MRKIFGVFRVAASAAIITAIVGQFAVSLTLVADPVAFVINFFSFFTILSNLLAAIWMLLGAWLSFTRRTDPRWFNYSRAAIVTYMTTTLVVYNLLLREVSLDQASTVGWSNEILHLWAPLYLVIDWLVAPGRSRIRGNRYGGFAVFPLAWVAYTMVRGALTGWYPYPFLNPSLTGSLGVVGVYVIAIAAFILLVGAGVVALTQRGRTAR